MMQYQTKQAFKEAFDRLDGNAYEQTKEMLESANYIFLVGDGLEMANRSFNIACDYCGTINKHPYVAADSENSEFTIPCTTCQRISTYPQEEICVNVSRELQDSISNVGRIHQREIEAKANSKNYLVISQKAIAFTNRYYEVSCACGYDGTSALVVIPMEDTEKYTIMPCPNCGDY